MALLGSGEPLLDWAWVQLRTGFRRRAAYPIPKVSGPGCRAGTVSTRRWFDWRQANSVAVFGIQFMRAFAQVAAEDGLTPTHDWMAQRWHKSVSKPNKSLSFMDPRGVDNAVGLINTIEYPVVDHLTLHYVVKVAVPKVIQTLPMAMTQAVDRLGHLIDPFTWEIDVRAPRDVKTFQPRNDILEVVLTSPHYYCGYDRARTPSHFGSRNWPLAVADELEPIVFDTDPFRVPRRSGVPQAVDEIVAAVRMWGGHLGFGVGPSEGEWVENPATGNARFVVTAPVALSASAEEIARRAEPYRGRITVRAASRGVPYSRRRLPLMDFDYGWPRFSTEITDPVTDGEYVLTVKSPEY